MLVFPQRYGKKSGEITWANGTVSQIAEMLQMHDNGDINIYDYWHIGDERIVHLNAIPANPNGAFINAITAQDVVMVLMDIAYGSNNIHFVVGQKNCLKEREKVNLTASNTGSWSGSLIRADLNTLYYNALDGYNTLLKSFDVDTIETYNGTTIQTTTDKIALFAEKEVFGYAYYGNETEANDLTQVDYYTDSSHRIKTMNGSTMTWFLRSPRGNMASDFCSVTSRGKVDCSGANLNLGIAPFMCI